MKEQIMKSKSAVQSVLIHLLTLMVLAVCASSAWADCNTWTGGGHNSDWFTAANWSAGLPTLATDVCINGGAKVVINQSGAFAKSLTLGDNFGDSGAVTVDGTGTNGGTLTTAAGGSDQGLAPIQGAIYVGNRGKGTLNIIHGGTVVSGYGYIAALAGQLAVSNGTVSVDGASSSWTVSSSSNEALSVGGIGGTNGGTGLLSITNGGLVTVNHNNGVPYAARVLTSGTLTGNSTIALTGPNYYAASLVINGTIAPTRELTIDGPLFFTPGGSAVCDVMSSDDPNQEHFNVEEQAALSGRLTVTMTGTFTPGTQFLLLHSDEGIDIG